MIHFLPLIRALLHLHILCFRIIHNQQYIMCLCLHSLTGHSYLRVAYLVDAYREGGVIARLDSFGEQFGDFAFEPADAVDTAVDDQLGREDAVAAPFFDVCLLPGVPGGVAEGIFPGGARVEVGYVEGEEEDVVVLFYSN